MIRGSLSCRAQEAEEASTGGIRTARSKGTMGTTEDSVVCKIPGLNLPRRPLHWSAPQPSSQVLGLITLHASSLQKCSLHPLVTTRSCPCPSTLVAMPTCKVCVNVPANFLASNMQMTDGFWRCAHRRPLRTSRVSLMPSCALLMKPERPAQAALLLSKLKGGTTENSIRSHP